jgi:hypothetical protein
MKLNPVGSELFHADRRTDMTEVLVVFAILRKRLKRDNDALLPSVSANCYWHECKWDDVIEKRCWWGIAAPVGRTTDFLQYRYFSVH